MKVEIILANVEAGKIALPERRVELSHPCAPPLAASATGRMVTRTPIFPYGKQIIAPTALKSTAS